LVDELLPFDHWYVNGDVPPCTLTDIEPLEDVQIGLTELADAVILQTITGTDTVALEQTEGLSTSHI
jgi:hypothetical protein